MNCNKPFTESELFCSSCGQRTTTHRFSLRSLFTHDFIHAVFHLDKGFFGTLKNLFLQPGTVVKEFLEGKRVKYFNYFTMILILITVGHFLQKYSPIKLVDLMTASTVSNKTNNKPFAIDTVKLMGKNAGFDSQQLIVLNQKIDSLKKRRSNIIKFEKDIAKEQEKIFNGFERFTKENPKLFYLILIPIYTFFTLIWFYKSKLNFSEQLITNIYKTCGDIVIGILFSIGLYIYPKISFWTIVYPFSSLLLIAYSTWFYQNFFKHYYKDAGIVFLKSLAAVLCVQLFIGIIAAIFMFIAGYNLGLKQTKIKEFPSTTSSQKDTFNPKK
ncbi:MAG: DUF3667 domain-containing protein [Chitinophagaceae bacterium]